MRWSFLLARIYGIEVRVHLTFLLLLGFYGVSAYPRGGMAAALTAVLFVCLIFFCVLLHEFGHAFAALAYGIRTPDITLLPIGGLARLERIPEKPVQELVIAIAGPLVNVVIALGLWVAMGGNAAFRPDRLFATDHQLLHALFSVNVTLVLFNLVPAFPMDGGRVLRAFLAMKLPYARATQIAASIGQFMAFVFGFIGLFGLKGISPPNNSILILVAFFIFMAASQESSAAQMRDFTRNVRLDEAMITEFKALPLDAKLSDAVELLLRSSQHEFPVVEADGRIRGILTRGDLISALTKAGEDAPVADHMRRDVPTVPFYAPFEEAFQLMQSSECPVLPVVDRNGRLVGLITPENVGEMMMIQSVLERKGGRSAHEVLICTLNFFRSPAV